MELFQGMFGKIAPGMCRLSMDGSIAIKTSGGYKTYSLKTGRLTNCDSFVFNIGEEFFFLVPTNKVRPGDIILAGGRPKCVLQVAGDIITAINYEDATVEQILPERHMLMGDTYFYGRIVSMFGRNGSGGRKGFGKVMKYMMLSEMLKGNAPGGKAGNNNPMGQAMLAMMMMGGKGDGLFDDLFSFDEEENEDTDLKDA